jgi:porin
LFEENGKRMDGFFRLGQASGRFNMFDRFASAGVKISGLVAGRADDEAGLAIAAAFTSSDYRRAIDAGRSEVAIEATYRAPLAEWLMVQPSIQYVRDPGADPAIRDAVVIGLRTEISFRLLN